MKKFLLKFAVYLIPLPVYIGIVLLIDPFNYAGISKWITDETKTSISEKLNPQLWKILEFKHVRSQRIILGDSRAGKIRDYNVKKLTGIDVYNFAYPGGTLVDMTETFWYADSLVQLKEVYMGINFNLYNGFETNNNFERAEIISKNFFSYAFSKIVFSTMIKTIKKQFFIKDMKIGKPDMSFEEFWAYQINVIGRRFYQKYKSPQKHYTELVKISNYCKEKNIKLVFFIPPNHIDWQQRIPHFNLEEENKQFINEISSLGTLYNFNIPNEYTKDIKNFFDPMHTKNDSVVVNTLWGNGQSSNYLVTR